jgi:hypothetical protein
VELNETKVEEPDSMAVEAEEPDDSSRVPTTADEQVQGVAAENAEEVD